jgi:alkaline phosphatase D
MTMILLSRIGILVLVGVSSSWLPVYSVAAANTATSTTTTKLAFGSCHKNKKATVPPIWDVIGREADLDAWIWTGDAMYPSGRDPVTGKKRYGPATPSELKQGFDDLKTNDTIGYRTNILSYNNNNNKNKNLKVYGTWDDHDYGGNDMGKGRNEKKCFWIF